MLRRIARERLAAQPEIRAQFLRDLEPVNPIGEEILARIHASIPVLIAVEAGAGNERALEFVHDRLEAAVDRFVRTHAREPKPRKPLGVVDLRARSGQIYPKRALVDLTHGFWPRVESDLSHAVENGLAKWAKPSAGRGWHVWSALGWAEVNGRLENTRAARDAIEELNRAWAAPPRSATS